MSYMNFLVKSFVYIKYFLGVIEMKTVFEILFKFCMVYLIGTSSLKFYHSLEKDLAIKLSTGLPSLSTFTNKLTR